ncbi:bifunctional heptose 7-phosphate kinase/heptose 1-phosphate adenyltransferase [Cytobacillus pseudoceanisediminis]|uniref:bifunctional heptose 7-phosphate kinase/heptose 1-phosphate adenyltransferase n=1 Tax=Cytobacillus pseudoceanisediminis TaxID=3051614 RepID=UPI003C2F7EFE
MHDSKKETFLASSDNEPKRIRKCEVMLNQTKMKNILVLGDLMLDEYIKGKVGFSSNEGVETFKIKKGYKFPGGTANVAANVAAMGANVYLAGVIGNDEAAEKLIRILEKTGNVNTDLLIREDNRRTTVRTRLYANNCANKIRVDIDTKKRLSKSTEIHLLDLVFEKLPNLDCIIISDYRQGVVNRNLARWMIKYANKNNIPILVDTKRKSLSLYEGATALFPNMLEFTKIVGKELETDEELVVSAREIIQTLNLNYLVVKNGAEGGLLITEEMYFQESSNKTKIVSTIGAGDSLIAGFAIGLALGYSPVDAFKLGIITATCAVKKEYTSTVTFEDIKQYSNNLLETLF